MLATTIHESNTTHPTTKDGATTTHPNGAQPLPVPQKTGQKSSGLVVSKPNSVFGDPFTGKNPEPAKTFVVHPTGHPLQAPAIFSQPPSPTWLWGWGNNTGAP
jgi:hypothetical protein